MAADSIDKVHRHQALLAILQEEEIGSQEVLRRALKRRGIPVTQATLSRDLKELRIPCVPTEYGYRYELPKSVGHAAATVEPAPKQMRSVAAMEVTAIEANETCVVVRTLTGRAQGMGVYLDGLRLPDVLATIGGDDTLLVLPRSVKGTRKLEKELATILGLD